MMWQPVWNSALSPNHLFSAPVGLCKHFLRYFFQSLQLDQLRFKAWGGVTPIQIR